MNSPLYALGDPTDEATGSADRGDRVEPTAPTAAPGPGRDPKPPRGLGRRLAGRAFKALCLTAVAFGVCVILALIAAATLHNAQRVRESLLAVLHVTHYAPLVYVGLFAMLWWRWDAAVDWVIRRGYMPDSARELLRSRRDRWVIWLCILALLMAWFSMR